MAFYISFSIKLPARYERLITVFFIFGWHSTFLQFERMMDIVLQ